MSKTEKPNSTNRAAGAKNLQAARVTKKGTEQAPPRAKMKPAKPPEPFTLEKLEQCAKRVGAPPLGDTPVVRRIVECISDVGNAEKINRRKNMMAWRKSNRLILQNFIHLLCQNEKRIEKGLARAQAEEDTFGQKFYSDKKDKLDAIISAINDSKGYLFTETLAIRREHLSKQYTDTEIWLIYRDLKKAWAEQGEEPSASRIHATIGAALLKVGIEISDAVIKKSVKTLENRHKIRNKIVT
jgi:hypothetical protein